MLALSKGPANWKEPNNELNMTWGLGRDGAGFRKRLFLFLASALRSSSLSSHLPTSHGISIHVF